MRNTYFIALCLSVAFATTSTAKANEDIVFTYDYEGATHDVLGVQRNVGIDAAMLLQEPSLTGCEIIGISVDIPVKEWCECEPIGSAWLSSRLQVEGEYNLPDLMQVNGEIKNYGTETQPELRLDLTFPEPYTLTDEGVYVGYSVTVKNCNVPGSGWTAKYPIVTVCDIHRPESFMIHCTKGTSTLPQKYPEWTDMGSSTQQALAMRVILKGKPMECAASLNPLQSLFGAPSTTGNVYAELRNLGSLYVSSVDYSYAIHDSGSEISRGEAHLDLDVPGGLQPGSNAMLDLPIAIPSEEGEYTVSLQVDQIDGRPNEFTVPTMFNLEVVPFIPTNRPLVEDFTALWCGYCPEAYVTIRQLQDKYGEDFLAASYHVDDRLQGVSLEDMPASTYGLPKIYMGNREETVAINNLEREWLLQRRDLAPADIDVALSWTDDTRSSLRADASLRFVRDMKDSEYMLGYALVEDDMSDPRWLQANYFYDKDYQGDYWDLFCGQGYRVAGIVDNDMVVSCTSTRGIPGSLPSAIIAGEEYAHSTVIPLKDAVCEYKASEYYGDNLIRDANKLRIVAFLIDGTTGEVCNSATTGYSADASVKEDSGVREITDAAGPQDIIATEYYAPDGRRLSALPSSGIVIRLQRSSDGKVHTTLFSADYVRSINR